MQMWQDAEARGSHLKPARSANLAGLAQVASFGAFQCGDLRLIPIRDRRSELPADGFTRNIATTEGTPSLRATAGFLTELVDISPVLTFIFLLAVMTWSFSLRKRVEDQTKQICSAQERETALEEKCRDLFERVNDLIFSLDLNGKLTSLNKAAERVLGCVRRPVLGMSLREFVGPEHLELFDKWLAQCLSGMAPPPLELEIARRDEGPSLLEVSGRLVYAAGKVAGIEGFARDITERKLAEAALRQSADRFSNLFSLSPMAIGISDLAEWRFIDINDSFVRLFGFQRDEVVNHTIAELALWADSADQARIEKVFWNEELVRGAACKFRAKSGDLRSAILFAKRISLGKVPCALILFHDITEYLDLAAQLGEALKMEAAGRMGVGVASDFDNLLRIIQEKTNFALQKKSCPPEIAQELKPILEATQCLASLIQKPSALSSEHKRPCRPLDLNEAVKNSVCMLKHPPRDDIVLKFRFYPNLPIVNADPILVEQMITSLVLNAYQAMPKGGDLTIATAPVEISRSYVETHPEAVAGHYVCLSVTDTGCGMDSPTQARILERVSTGQEAGNGAGLGLATVCGLVKQHAGWVKIISQVGQGSTLRIFLPSEPVCG